MQTEEPKVSNDVAAQPAVLTATGAGAYPRSRGDAMTTAFKPGQATAELVRPGWMVVVQPIETVA